MKKLQHAHGCKSMMKLTKMQQKERARTKTVAISAAVVMKSTV
jgi:hypothetical protein